MVRPAIEKWPKSRARLGWLEFPTGKFDGGGSKDESRNVGFFGACDSKLDSHRYVGVGGMNAITKEMLRGAQALAHNDRLHLHTGTRVARCERVHSTWKLYGDGLGHEDANAGALHESKERELGTFDELVITDHMALAMPSWHPCHIDGLNDIVPELISKVRAVLKWDETARRFRSVVPLFSCMLAVEGTLSLEFDAAVIQGSEVLQWVCSQESRPHGKGDATNHLERWVLVSKAEFAERCLEVEGMSKLSQASTAAPSETSIQYVPQTNEYLRADPADLMVQAFLDVVERSRDDSANHVNPKIVFRKCQRWGAAFTDGGTHKEKAELVNALERHEDTQSITICGDFVYEILNDDSGPPSRAFSVQGAALTGFAAASRLAARLRTGTDCSAPVYTSSS